MLDLRQSDASLRHSACTSHNHLSVRADSPDRRWVIRNSHPRPQRLGRSARLFMDLESGENPMARQRHPMFQ